MICAGSCWKAHEAGMGTLAGWNFGLADRFGVSLGWSTGLAAILFIASQR